MTDTIKQRLAEAGLIIKPLVWSYHPIGDLASTGLGSAYIIDKRDATRIRWGKWPGGHGPERVLLPEFKAAAQTDYEVRILAALEVME